MILYEDRDIIVCHKPAGIAVQTAQIGQRDMVSEVTNYLAAKARPTKKGAGRSYVGLIHRLDQPVEGLLVLAKNPKAANELSRQMAENRMQKEYMAVVFLPETSVAKETEGSDGNISRARAVPEKGSLMDYLYKDGRKNRSFVVEKEHPGARQARLMYEVAEKKDIREFTANEPYASQKEVNAPLGEAESAPGAGELALVKIRLLTGRHHQIRVQMSHAGMSLLGDYKYADERTKELSECVGQKQVALCAYRLGFLHPATGKEMLFQTRPKGQIFQKFSL